jgi:signal transduction histidine kinase
MKKKQELSDELLLDELKKRLNAKNQSLQLQQTMLMELEGLNDRLRDADRMKSGFLSNIRNEINNPLTSIIGLAAQLMTGKGMDEEKIHRISFLISKEAFSLDFQMRNIFSAAEIEAGEVNVRPSMVDVEELVRGQINYFNLKIEQRKIKITVLHKPLSGEKIFKTDPFILHSIIMNLLANAIEFSPEQGNVILQTEINDKQLTLQVQDFGEGISESEYKHIFDRFKQLEGGTTKKHQGHGLGLSIVKEFVDDLRGTLDIQSEKGKTTIITVGLPSLSEDMVPEGFSNGDEILFGDEEVL